MKIDYPAEGQLPQLRRLWKEAFGDDDPFLDLFFENVYSSDRCRCITVVDSVVAALYWLDCRCNGRPIAYLYAVATGKKHRGKGLCRTLMADTHRLLQGLGYAGCILVPGEFPLFEMYGSMGYRPCSTIREFTREAGPERASLHTLTPEEFAAARRQYLAPGAVIQEGDNLTFLTKLARFYQGPDFLLCAAGHDDNLFAMELLGNTDAASGILTALGKEWGTFRTPGQDREFAMYYPLTDAPAPNYLGFAFD